MCPRIYHHVAYVYRRVSGAIRRLPTAKNNPCCPFFDLEVNFRSTLSIAALEGVEIFVLKPAAAAMARPLRPGQTSKISAARSLGSFDLATHPALDTLSHLSGNASQAAQPYGSSISYSEATILSRMAWRAQQSGAARLSTEIPYNPS